jgi:AraC family transcriptional regulator, regulatory protein of adaptative response / methylated-DNA-[protein]-cysteine methyltransferase
MDLIVNMFSNDAFRDYIQRNTISYRYYQTVAGKMQVLITDRGIYEASFVDNQAVLSKDQNYYLKQDGDITKLLLVGTPFQLKVWQAVLQIPVGQTASYQDIAHFIGYPRSWRAVANALAHNKVAYFIPCHRVIRKSGELANYKWGSERKMALLASEGCLI